VRLWVRTGTSCSQGMPERAPDAHQRAFLPTHLRELATPPLIDGGLAISLPMRNPAPSNCARADKGPERCQPRPSWNSFEPPGRGNRTTCSISGKQPAMAPTVAGSRAPRRAATRLTTNKPLPISKRRSWMSWCGTRSPTRCDDRPSAAAAARERTAAPTVAPKAACSETITLGR
jgi:hypothetical protein